MSTQPPRSWVHLALVLSNSCFGLGSIIGTVGLSGMNPFRFSLVRVLVAGSLLLLVSLLIKVVRRKNSSIRNLQQQHSTTIETEGLLTATTTMEEDSANYHRILEEYSQNYHYPWRPFSGEDWKLFWVFGFLVSLGMSGYLCGLHLAGPIAGSIWQPSMPIWTVAICMVWKLEKVQFWRVVGVFVAFGGYVGMILLKMNINGHDHGTDHPNDSDDEQQYHHQHSSIKFLFGNFLFFLACTAGSCSVLLSKKLLKVYPPLTVTAWSFLLSSPFLLLATIGSSSIPAWQALVCPDDCIDAWDGSIGSLLYIPKEALPAFLYYVVFMSVVAWILILWANQHVTGTFVVGYSVVQPITSSFFVVLLLAMKWVPDCQDDDMSVEGGGICLDRPGFGALAGMIGILVGLGLIVHTEPKRDEPSHPEWQGLKVLSIETNFAETHNAIYGSMVSNGSTSLLRP